MYSQLQSYPTPFLWLKTPPRIFKEVLGTAIALDSLLLLLPMQRTVAEDFPPNAVLSLESVFVVPPPGPQTRAIAEDFPPTGTIQLVSVISILPMSRTVTEDFPPTATVSLDNLLVVLPIIESPAAETATATISLQSIVV